MSDLLIAHTDSSILSRGDKMVRAAPRTVELAKILYGHPMTPHDAARALLGPEHMKAYAPKVPLTFYVHVQNLRAALKRLGLRVDHNGTHYRII